MLWRSQAPQVVWSISVPHTVTVHYWLWLWGTEECFLLPYVSPLVITNRRNSIYLYQFHHSIHLSALWCAWTSVCLCTGSGAYLSVTFSWTRYNRKGIYSSMNWADRRLTCPHNIPDDHDNVDEDVLTQEQKGQIFFRKFLSNSSRHKLWTLHVSCDLTGWRRPTTARQ